jgi:predicted ester cyclase
MIALSQRAIACFNDPARREEYFELYDDDISLHGYTPEPLTPKPALVAFYADVFSAFPDARVETDDMFAAGSKLAWRFRFAGTHEGEFMGAAPSGRSFEVPGMTILRFGDERCVERWAVTDLLGLMTQIGVIDAPGG